jgi:hypothetical protein
VEPPAIRPDSPAIDMPRPLKTRSRDHSPRRSGTNLSSVKDRG